jgi:hypothetical protein
MAIRNCPARLGTLQKSGAFYFYPERDKRDQSHHGTLPGASKLLRQSRRVKRIIMLVMHHLVFLHLWSEKHVSVWTEKAAILFNVLGRT